MDYPYVYGGSPLSLRAGLPGRLLRPGERGRRPCDSNCAAIPIILLRGDSCAARSPNIWIANIRRSACSIRKSASARRARANSNAFRGTEALETITDKLTASISREFGPESILPYSYAGTMGLLNGGGMDRRFFHRLGASRLDRTICSSAGGAALTATLGYRYGTEPEQFRHSKMIVAWAANIHGTNVHLWPFIVEARRQGAKLWVIDPIRTRTAALADRHLRINPGTDLALALGLAHIIIGEKLYDADYVAQLYKRFRCVERPGARL